MHYESSPLYKYENPNGVAEIEAKYDAYVQDLVENFLNYKADSADSISESLCARRKLTFKGRHTDKATAWQNVCDNLEEQHGFRPQPQLLKCR